MATIEHSALTTGELHEPKGIANANPNTVYIADGAGSGSWRLQPNGHIFATNPTGFTYTTPTSFTLVNSATTTSGTQREFSHNNAGRLTYTGSSPITVAITATVHAGITAATSVSYRLGKNAVLDGVGFGWTGTANSDQTATITFQLELITNDYVECYLSCASGDMKLYSYVLDVRGVI